jgi:hypothetical protein
LKKTEAGDLAETIQKRLRLYWHDIEWGLDGIAHASGTRGFRATVTSGQRFEVTVHEVAAREEVPPANDDAVRKFKASGCYGNNDSECRASALAQAARAFPGCKLEITGSYFLSAAVRNYERSNGRDYREQEFVASTITVKATS